MVDGTIGSEGKNEDALCEVLHKAFQRYKKGLLVSFLKEARDEEDIDISLLTECALLKDCLLVGESPPLTEEQVATGVAALLHWLVAKLNPGGEADFADSKYQDYFLLNEYYLRNKKANDVRRELGYESANYILDLAQNRSVPQAAKRLILEIKNPQDVSGRKWHLLDRCYRALSPDQQMMLRILILSTEAMAIELLERVIKLTYKRHDRPVDDKAIILDRQALQKSRLVIQPSPDLLAIHSDPAVRDYLIEWSTIDPIEERASWHNSLGDYYGERNAYIQAGSHWLKAGRPGKTIYLLDKNYKELIEAGLHQPLQELLGKIDDQILGTTERARLALTKGKVAEMGGALEIAFAEYNKALSTRDDVLKAEAYLLTAKLSEHIRAHLTLDYYEAGIEFLSQQTGLTYVLEGMLVDLLIDQAWFLMENQQNPEDAKKRITQAYKLIAPDEGKPFLIPDVDKRRSAWFDAAARLTEHFENDFETYIDLTKKAYVLAKVAGDKDRQMKATLNLAMGYAFAGHPEQGLVYAQEALDIAFELGDQKLVANSYRIFGACYFFKKQYLEAIAEYKKAYNLFESMGNLNWLGWVCHDLSEAYAEVGKQEKAKRYYFQAKGLAKETVDKQLTEALQELLEKHPWTEVPLTPEQRQVFECIQEHEPIGRKEIVDHLQMPKRTLIRRLNELLEADLIERVGQGRATKYVIRK